MIARGFVEGAGNDAVTAVMPALSLGTTVRVATTEGWKQGTVVRADAQRLRIALACASGGVVTGACVEEDPCGAQMALGTAALGRAIDAYGEPLDGGPRLAGARAPGAPSAIPAAARAAVEVPLWTGVRAIDAMLTIGRGARVGIFGSPGAGKSTLLETIVKGVDADAVVLALVGERGRETEQWIARCDARTTIVSATSDRSASERIAAANTAFAHAQALARRGLHVVLVLDSLARVAYALREMGTAHGEPVGRGGYPPSTFAALARLVECAGAMRHGSISLLATVLDDGGDRDPVSDAARSLLDGHIELSARLAQAGRFPAVDVLASASRTMSDVAEPAHLRAAATVRRFLALLEASRDLRSLGIESTDPETRAAVEGEPAIDALLRQGREAIAPGSTLAMLLETADTLGEPHGYRF